MALPNPVPEMPDFASMIQSVQSLARGSFRDLATPHPFDDDRPPEAPHRASVGPSELYDNTGQLISPNMQIPSAGNFNYNPNDPNSLRRGIFETAMAVGADPLDLAQAISFETGGTMDPLQAGPTTKWGTHRGLIQWGEPQAQQYGVDFSSPEAALSSQLGAGGAIARYLRDRGYQPGMSGMDLYSTINAGRPGLYNRSDTHAGGTAGSVADKWNSQMSAHRRNSYRMLYGR